MKSYFNFRKIKRICKNIRRNVSKLMRKNKVFDFILTYKYPVIFVIILSLFIGKNIFLLGSYSMEIKALESQVEQEEAKKKQLEEDIKYYNTDEFVFRYSLEKLNMRPTKESKWLNISIKKPSSDKNSDDSTTDNNLEVNTDHTSEDNSDSENSLDNEHSSNNDSTLNNENSND